jgi:hypothetical protein
MDISGESIERVTSDKHVVLVSEALDSLEYTVHIGSADGNWSKGQRGRSTRETRSIA